MKREYGNEWKDDDDDEIYDIIPIAMKKPI